MSDIFSIGLSGLQASQIAIATSSENISNETTTGYVTESAVFEESAGQYTGAGYIGSGVTTATVQRAYSQFLTTQLNNAQSSNSAITASYTLATQLNNLIGSSTSGIASAINSVFTGMQTISSDASSEASRQSAISDMQTLVNDVNNAGEQYDSIRSSINTQLSGAVTQINQYSQQIAQLNEQITAASSQGQPPNQLLDERDLAVSNLSQLVGVSVVSNSSGYSVFLGNGQPLVVGTQNFNLTTEASSSDPSELTVAYQGLPNSTATPQAMSTSALTGGTVGGLLSFRTDTLDPAEAKLGAIVTSFTAQLNGQNSLGITPSGVAGGALFSVAAPTVVASSTNTSTATLTASLTNAASPPSDTYKLSFDGTNYTLTDSTSGQVVGQSTSLATAVSGSGLSVTLNGTMAAGDSFSIQPTSGALDSFKLSNTSPDAIAASSPVVGAAVSTNTGTGSISDSVATQSPFFVPTTSTTITYTASTTGGTTGTLSGFAPGSTVSVLIPGSTTPTVSTIDAAGNATPAVSYDPTQGATITVTNTDGTDLSGISFKLSGTPATGDQFTLTSNAAGSSDGSNAIAMADLASSTALSNTTLNAAYANYVNSVGNQVNQLEASSTSQTALVSQLTSQQQSVEGVNLDEEAANLEKYQELYQANSKVIQTAASLFQTLIGIFS